MKVTPSTGSAIVHNAADSMAVRGLDIDGTLPTGFPGTTYGIYVSGSYGITSYNAVLTWRAPLSISRLRYAIHYAAIETSRNLRLCCNQSG